jgi:hypothetical protein
MAEDGTGTGSAAGLMKPCTYPLSSLVRRRSVRFKEADVARAIRAAQKAKLPIAGVRIEPDGAILIIPGTPEAMPSSAPNPWDGGDA